MRRLRITLLILLLLFLALFFLRAIDLSRTDLGRHLENGEIFVETWRPISTNHYSYTEPERVVLNHHWGSGVVFHLVWRVAGFEGLSVFNVLCYLAAFLLFFEVGRERSTFERALLAAVLSAPLWIHRLDIRPEVFSDILLGAFLLLLVRFNSGRIGFKPLLGALVVLQVLWVNLHVFFAFGVLLTALFSVWFAWDGDRRQRLRATCLTSAVALACLLNPFGLEGALAPWTAFREYGFDVAENQPVLFWLRRLWPEIGSAAFQQYFHHALLSVLVLVTTVRALPRLRDRTTALLALLLVGFAGLAWAIGRGLPLFGLAFVALWPAQLAPQPRNERVGRVVLGLVLVAVVGFHHKLYWPFHQRPAIGLAPGVQDSARFFKAQSIRGPLFNNFDIGGYLIFHLFPEERVFVDNRPEAYSAAFLKRTFIPMQVDEARWHEMESRYGVQAIFFHRGDRTPWSRAFIRRRLFDPRWAAVWADRYAIILVRRTPEHRRVIERYEMRPPGK